MAMARSERAGKSHRVFKTGQLAAALTLVLLAPSARIAQAQKVGYDRSRPGQSAKEGGLLSILRRTEPGAELYDAPPMDQAATAEGGTETTSSIPVAKSATDAEQQELESAAAAQSGNLLVDGKHHAAGSSVRDNEGRIFKRIYRYFTRTEAPATAKAAPAKADKETLVRDSKGGWSMIPVRGTASGNPSKEYAAAEALFRAEKYSDSAKAFKRIAKQFQGTPVEEDALFMQAESEFLQDRLPKAQDLYAGLLKKYPTTRHLPQAIQRTYDIAYFWLEDSRLASQGKPTKHSSFTNSLNFVDKKRPILDTEGRAIEAIQTIQQYDPFGPLTDDAVMMAGAYKFVNGHYYEAATFYETMIADQPKSEHAARATVLGAQSYLRAYDGPVYDGSDLESAERLTKAALARGIELPADQREKLERDLRLIHLERAKREYTVAEHYMRNNQNLSARYYLAKISKDYNDTDYGKRSEQEIARIDSLPPSQSTLSKMVDIVRWDRKDNKEADAAATDVAKRIPAADPNASGDTPEVLQTAGQLDSTRR